VEEARFRPDSGTEENARIVVEKKPIPPLSVHSRHQRDRLLLER
jgi:hypothetical protein